MSSRKKPEKENLTVFFRVDSSSQMGTGHLMRCLTLARELKERGAKAVFVCRDHPGNLRRVVKERGFICHLLPVETSADQESLAGYSSWVGGPWEQDAAMTARVIQDYASEAAGPSLLVVDHYGLDYPWEKELRPYVNKILVIDDLANRAHECDFLLDQNLYENMEERYQGLVSEYCRLFLGPRYALIRKEFREAKKRMKKRSGKIERVLVFMGGIDPTNETMKALEALEMLGRPDITVDVVVGAKNPHIKAIEEKCRQMPNTNFHVQTDRMAELMAEADLAIGGGGTTTWERCYMELPSITVEIADNQRGILKALHSIGATVYLGTGAEVDIQDIAETLTNLSRDRRIIEGMITVMRGLNVGTESLANSALGFIAPA